MFHQPGNKQHVFRSSLVYPSDPPSNRESEVRSGCYNSARITQFCRQHRVLNITQQELCEKTRKLWSEGPQPFCLGLGS